MKHPDVTKFADIGKTYYGKMKTERAEYRKLKNDAVFGFRARNPELHSKLMALSLGKKGRLLRHEFHAFLFPDSQRKCSECGKHTAFDSHIWEFKKWCSLKCLWASGHVKEKVTAVWSDRTQQERDNIATKSVVTRKRDATKHAQSYVKKAKTCLERYGVEHPIILPNVSHKFKTYTDSKGNKHKVQGYEDKALKLIEARGKIKNIISSKSEIRKQFPVTYANQRVYYPDLIINMSTGERRVVEVKSCYYFIKDLSKNLKKFTSCQNELKKKDTFWLFLFDKTGKTCACVKNPTSKTDIKAKLRKQGFKIEGTDLVKL